MIECPMSTLRAHFTTRIWVTFSHCRFLHVIFPLMQIHCSQGFSRWSTKPPFNMMVFPFSQSFVSHNEICFDGQLFWFKHNISHIMFMDSNTTYQTWNFLCFFKSSAESAQQISKEKLWRDWKFSYFLRQNFVTTEFVKSGFHCSTCTFRATACGLSRIIAPWFWADPFAFYRAKMTLALFTSVLRVRESHSILPENVKVSQCTVV